MINLQQIYDLLPAPTARQIQTDQNLQSALRKAYTAGVDFEAGVWTEAIQNLLGVKFGPDQYIEEITRTIGEKILESELERVEIRRDTIQEVKNFLLAQNQIAAAETIRKGLL
jgi:hypothetical protein